MKLITIRYRPISFLPIYRTVTGSFPQNWGDVSAKQLIAIACLYKNNISEVQFLNRMNGIPVRVLKRCDDYERFKLMEPLEFIGDRRPFHEFIIRKLSLPVNRFPNLFRRHPELVSGPLHAPSSKLKGITFGQFIFADTYFSNYQATAADDDLNKFIASLYLRKDEKFEEKWIEQRHSAIGNIDRATREAIVINYTLIREWLSLAYPLIFQKRNEMDSVSHPELVSGPDNKPTNDHNTWIKIFQNFVGDDILHDDQWASKPINTIFQYMTRKYKENARRKN